MQTDIRSGEVTENDPSPIRLLKLAYAAQQAAAGGIAPTGAAGGDLSGTYPNPTVVRAPAGTLTGTALPAAITSAPGLGIGTPFDAGNKTGAASVALSDGPLQNAATTGNVTALTITGGAAGNRLELWLKAGGTHTFTTAYTLPSDSAVTLPKTLTSGKNYVIVFKYIDGAWRLVSLVGGW